MCKRECSTRERSQSSRACSRACWCARRGRRLDTSAVPPARLPVWSSAGDYRYGFSSTGSSRFSRAGLRPRLRQRAPLPLPVGSGCRQGGGHARTCVCHWPPAALHGSTCACSRPGTALRGRRGAPGRLRCRHSVRAHQGSLCRRTAADPQQSAAAQVSQPRP
jgi:hypothetical protein